MSDQSELIKAQQIARDLISENRELKGQLRTCMSDKILEETARRNNPAAMAAYDNYQMAIKNANSWHSTK